MSRFSWLFAVSSLCSTVVFASQAIAQDTAADDAKAGPSYQFMLVGGALKTCSSMGSRNCDSTDWIDRNTMRMDRYLNLGSKYRAAALDDRVWPALRRPTRDKVAAALDTIFERVQEEVIPERVFQEEFQRRATRHLYNELSDAEWNRIIDHLEMPVPDGLTERVNIKENLNKASRGIVERFVALAGEARGTDKPEILVVTASSRDPFDAVDFYLDLFADAGANTTWLPMDAAVAAARRKDDCDNLDSYRPKALGSWDRARVYRDKHKQQVAFCKNPDQALEMVAGADAIFFNGGDQNLTRNAFVTVDNRATELLSAINKRVQENSIVIGGTSAGTAVMSARPMLTNGTSRSAMKDGATAAEPPSFGCNKDNTCPRNLDQDSLTYHPLGGLGLFPYAILDTHFSERGRHARLMRLAATTGTPMGIGVDETTALMVNVHENTFRVFGERGVFFTVDAQQTSNAVASGFHYLLDGSHGSISDKGISDVQLSDTIDLITAEPRTKFMSDRGAIDALRLLCSERQQMRLVEDAFTMMLQTDENSVTKKTGGECQIMDGRIGVIYQEQKQL